MCIHKGKEGPEGCECASTRVRRAQGAVCVHEGKEGPGSCECASKSTPVEEN